MNNDIAVKTEGLVKTFSGVEVIRGCTMTVYKGTIYGFLGGNGAGKTTVMTIVASFILCAVFGNAVIGSFGNDTVLIMILMIIVAIGAMIIFNLMNTVNRMEIE